MVAPVWYFATLVSFQPGRHLSVSRKFADSSLPMSGNLSRYAFVELLSSYTSSFWVSSSVPLLEQGKADEGETVCPGEQLVPETAIPGAYSSPCMNLAERVIHFDVDDYGNSYVSIEQGVSGSGRTGLAVWNSGLILMRLVVALSKESKRRTGQTQWENLKVLELGCGTGLVSIVAAKTGVQSVLATDGNPEVIELAQSNVRRNHVDGIVETKELTWGLLNAIDFAEMGDLVIGSDLTYNSGTWPVLAETMETVLSPKGFVLYLSLGHDGFNVNAEVDGFLSLALQKGLEPVSEIPGFGVSPEKLIDHVVSPGERSRVLQSGFRVLVLQKARRRKLAS